MTREELVAEVKRLSELLSKRREDIRKLRNALRKQMQRSVVSSISCTDYTDIVFAEVENYFGISKELYLSGTRNAPLIRCKTIAGYLLRTTTDMSLYEIGAACRVDHACISHYMKVMKDAYSMRDKDTISDRICSDTEIIKAAIDKKIVEIEENRSNFQKNKIL